MGYLSYPPTKRKILLEAAAAHDVTISSSGGKVTLLVGDVVVSDRNPRAAAQALCIEPQYNAALFAFGVHDEVANPFEKAHRQKMKTERAEADRRAQEKLRKGLEARARGLSRLQCGGAV